MQIKTTNSSPQQQVKQQSRLLLQIKKKLTLRLVVQAFIVLVMIISAWHFYGFYQYLQVNDMSINPYRPPVVEGFLPIAGIVAFKAMFLTGTIDPIHPAGLIIFITVLVTSLIFRRALCSWICPIGTLSEYLGHLGEKLIGKNLTMPKWLDMIFLGVKYLIFAFVFYTFFLNFPAEQAISFMQIPYYTISDMKMFELFLRIGFTGLLFIAIFMLLSVLFKSFWCRYLCPYGALIGILGVFSPFVLKKSSASCIDCGRCNKVCPNKVDVQGRNSVVISTECTGCTSCVSACPVPNTLEFKLFGIMTVKPLVFGLCFIAVFFGIIIWAMAAGYWHSNVPSEQYQLIYQTFANGFGGF